MTLIVSFDTIKVVFHIKLPMKF